MKEISRLLSSTIIGTHRQDARIFLDLTVLTGLVLSLKCRSVALIATEPDMPRVAALRVWLRNGLLSRLAWCRRRYRHPRFRCRLRACQPRPARPDCHRPRPNGQKPVLPGAVHVVCNRRHHLRPRQPLRLPNGPDGRRLSVCVGGLRLDASCRVSAVARNVALGVGSIPRLLRKIPTAL